MPIITQSSQNNEVNWDDPLNKGLVAWYPLQLGGNVRRDVVGNNHGTLNGNVTQGVYSHAPGGRLIFDDTSASDFVSGDGNFFKGNAISFFAEVTKDQINRDVIFSNGSAVGVNDGWSYQVRDDGSLWFTLQGVNSYITSAAIFGSGGGNRLRQLGFCWDAVASKVYMYSEGRLIDTLNTGSMLGTPSIFRIGDHLQFPGNPVRVKVGDIRIYDRVLTESEVHDLHQASRTGYKDQFKRRYFPVSTTVEEPPAEETSGGLIRLKSPKQSQPSYAAGYAKSASESAYPELWEGLKVAYSPQLGHRGSVSQLDIVKGRVLTRNRIGTSVEDVASERGIVSEITNAKSLSAPIDWDALGFTDGGFSYFMEINPSVAGNGNVPLSGEYVSFGNEGFFQSFYSSGFVFRIHGENDTSWIGRKSTVGQSTGWKNIACTWGGSGTSSDIAIYFDAVRSDTLDEQSGTFDTAQSTAGGLSIGAQGTAGLLNGACDGQYGTILLYNRALSPSEIQQLHADPLAPFRQRKSVPYTLTSTPPVQEETAGGLIRLKSPKQSQPSYKTGYAKSASESAYPDLWKGLQRAWVPMMGATGEQLRDISGSECHGNLTSMDPSTDWVSGQKGMYLDFDGGNDYVLIDKPVLKSASDRPLSITAFFRTDTQQRGSLYCEGYSADSSDLVRLAVNEDLGTENNIALGIRDQNDTELKITSGDLGVTDGDWHSVTGIVSNIYAGLWFDGTFQLEDTSAAMVLPRLNQSAIGALRRQSGQALYYSGGIGSVLVHNRALSPSEIQQLHADPLAPFRQRKSVPYTLTSTPPVQEETAGGLIRLKSPKQTQPSYAAGYAKSASESANPELWKGLNGAWVPNLGFSGESIPNVGTMGEAGVLTNMDPSTDWVVDQGGIGVETDGVNDGLGDRIRFGSQPELRDFSIIMKLSIPSWVQSNARILEQGGYNVGFSLTRGGSGSGLFCYVNSTNTTSTMAFPLGRTVNLAYIRKFNQYHAFYFDGEFAGAGGVAGAGTKVAQSSQMEFSARLNTSSALGKGTLHSLCMYDRALSYDEVLKFNADPLAPFRQRRTAIYSTQATAPPAFNHWYTRPGRKHRIVGSGVYV